MSSSGEKKVCEKVKISLWMEHRKDRGVYEIQSSDLRLNSVISVISYFNLKHYLWTDLVDLSVFPILHRTCAVYNDNTARFITQKRIF